MHAISFIVRFIMTVYAINKYEKQGDIKIQNEQILKPLHSVAVVHNFLTFFIWTCCMKEVSLYGEMSVSYMKIT